MVVESVVYLMLWQVVAQAHGGAVDGWSVHGIAAYFIVWALVRNMNATFPPHGFEDRIREGAFSAALLRPLHPLHQDLAEYSGWKFVMFVLWIPVAIVLTLNVTPTKLVVFLVAIWGAFLVRTLYLWLLGMTTFWTTRASALFDVVLALELMLSGRLVPTGLLPDWAANLADFLPFKWAFGFPIESLVAELSPAQLAGGLAMQALWIAIGIASVSVVWRAAVRQHIGVGN
jgi:ABC-2 type transport system permease protein